MTIIDNIKPASPILEYVPKPTFKTDLEKQRYWQKQKDIWINGIGDIPGTLCFKTQEEWIKDRDIGTIFRPICRDVDLLIHQEIAKSRKAGEALLIIKGRGVGLSVEFGCLTNYFMRVFPGSTSLLTSKDQPAASSLFSEKVMVTYERMDTDIRPEIVNKNETKNSSYLKVEVKYADENGETKFNNSKCFVRETSDSVESATAFSGEGAMFGAMDEIFLHKRRKELILSSTSCFMNAKTRTMTGFLLAGGTIEPRVNNEQLAELQILVREVQETGMMETMPCRLLFIPCWMGTFMTNGWSDEKKGIEWWEKEVEKLSKLGSKTALRAFRMNNPMSLDDIFELTSGGAYEDDVGEMLKATAENLRKNPPIIQKTKFVKVGDKIETAQTKEPNIYMLEQPKPNVQYWQLVDGTGTGTKTGNEDGSETAGIIVKGFDPTGDSYVPVNILLQRFTTVEQSYMALGNQLRYYNIHNGMVKCCAEGNAGLSDHFSTFLEKEGLGKFIQMRKDLSGKGNVEKNKPFQYIGVDEVEFQYRFMNIFLRKYGHNIKFLMLIEDMLKPMSVNADMRSAFNMLSIALPTNFDKPIVHKKPLSQGRLVLVNKNGKTAWEWQMDKKIQTRGVGLDQIISK